MSDFIGPTGMLSSGPAPGGWELGSAATPIFKPPTGMTYGSGVGASSGIGSGLAPTLGRFAGGLLGGLTGSRRSQQSEQPQPSRMAGSPEFLKALQAFSSKNSGGGFTNMGDGFSMYQPPAPGATITETTESEGGTAGKKGLGQRFLGAGLGALSGGLTGGPAGAVVGGVSGFAG